MKTIKDIIYEPAKRDSSFIPAFVSNQNKKENANTNFVVEKESYFRDDYKLEKGSNYQGGDNIMLYDRHTKEHVYGTIDNCNYLSNMFKVKIKGKFYICSGCPTGTTQFVIKSKMSNSNLI